MLVGASGDCLQASAAGGFGLPTSAKWTHPLGVLLAAYTPNATCDPKKHLRPAGSRARRRPMRRAPLALLVASPPASSAGRGGQQKKQRIRLEESSARSPPPAEGTHSVSCWLPLPQTRGLQADIAGRLQLYFCLAALCDRRSLGIARKQALLSPTASVVNRKNQRNLSTHPGGMLQLSLSRKENPSKNNGADNLSTKHPLDPRESPSASATPAPPAPLPPQNHGRTKHR